MTVRFFIAASALSILLGGYTVQSATAEGASVAESCPAYRTHLRTARACLARGDRGATLIELQRAQQALESCLRDDAGEVALASCKLWKPVG